MFQCFVFAIVVGFAILCYAVSQVLPIKFRWRFNTTLHTVLMVAQLFLIAFTRIACTPFQTYAHPNGEFSVLMYPTVLRNSSDHNKMLPFSFFVFATLIAPFNALSVFAVVRLYRFRNDVEQS